MKRIIFSAIAALLLGSIAQAQTNPGFNPNTQWGTVQGSIAFRGPSIWQGLLPGSAGQALISGGAGANPYWQTLSGTGTVTSVNGSGGTTGLSLTGGPITGAGTLTIGGTLAPTNGGTGLTALGANGTALTIVSGAPAWSSIVNSSIAGTGIAVSSATGNVTTSLAPIGAQSVLANITGSSAVPVPNSIGSILDTIGNTQGSILYRNVGGWSALGPGLSGQFLQTSGAGANPSWQTVSGGSLGSIPNNSVIANISGGAASPTSPTVSQLLDSAISNTQGALAYRNASGWISLAPGTSGALLQTGGTGANPAWGTIGQYKAVNDNSSASSGNVGEVISSNILEASAVSVSNDVATNVTSITLTAGDWDISANGYFLAQPGSVINYRECSISATSATRNTTSPFYAVNYRTITTGGLIVSDSLVIPPTRISLNSSVTYYLVCFSYHSTAGASAFGEIRARRMR